MGDLIHLGKRSHEDRVKLNLSFVPTKRWLVHKVEASYISKYSDDVVDLEIAIDQPNVSPTARYIDFSRFDPSHQDILRSYAWCELNLAAGNSVRSRGVRPSRLRREVERLAQFLRFMQDRNCEFVNFCKDDAAAWLDHAGKQAQATRVHAARTIRTIFQYRNYIPIDLPSGEEILEYLASGNKDKGIRYSENRTPRVPHNVLDPTIRWALFYINFASINIFEALNEHSERIGYNRLVTSDNIAKIPETQISWRAKGDVYNLNLEARCLVTAAYFITGFLSGMRDSEVQDINEGSWGVEKDEAGNTLYCWVKSRTFKIDAAGKERPWIVIEEVLAALDIITRLGRIMSRFARHPEGTQNLQLVFRRYTYIKSAAHEKALHNAAIADGMAKRLNEFQSHVKWLMARAKKRARTKADRETIERLYRIAAGPDGTDWRWITKHLRRTIAWYIGNEPFGVVAGQRQYGHLRDVTFQGYGGDPESGFRDEVQRARELGQQRDILDLYNQVAAGEHLAGPAGRRIEAELVEISKKLGELPGKVVDEVRLKAMLKNVAKVVYPLILNDCFFDADTALCLHGVRAEARKAPIPAQCDFEKCPNSGSSAKHAAIIDSSLSEAKAHRLEPGLSKNQRAALDLMIGKYERVKRGFGGGG